MKAQFEGELFVLVEESDGDVSVTAEINGINIFDWLQQNNGCKVKVTLEKEDLK
jgi:hypothetical protein